jgi:hypothetical protein
VSGHLAVELLGNAAPSGRAASATVRLRTPPPLDRPMEVSRNDDGVELRDGDVLVAEARQAEPLDTEDVPAPVTFADAEAAGAAYEGLVDHPFPTCYSCGIARTPDEALCLRPGRVGDGGLHAASWVPREPTFEDVWAALDCPGAWALGVSGRPMVLGTMTATVTELPAPGSECVVMAWVVGSEGRKHRCGTALYEGDRLVGQARATWIAVDPATVRPAGSPT